MADGNDVTVGKGTLRFKLGYRDAISDQGVCISVYAAVDGEETELLRFDCFEHQPHYHYGPRKEDERLYVDQTTEGDPVEWTLFHLSNRLPAMLDRAGYPELAADLDMDALEPDLLELGAAARRMARDDRATVKYMPEIEFIVDAGPVRFGLEYNRKARGVGIYVLGEVNGQEVDLLAIDCYATDAHYHYGPRGKNQRFFLDMTVHPDSLRWGLDLLKGGKLAPMLERAGYPEHAARLNPAIVAEKVADLESLALQMREAHEGRPSA